MKKLIIVAFVFACFFSTAQHAKYVFLFIGDGMGVNQIYSTELFMDAQSGVIKDSKLLMNTFPVSSNMTTYAADTYVPCSSSTGTAMSTGYKTNNGVLCKSPDLSVEYETFSSMAKNEGFKVGIVSSVAIDHATPASFYAHQDARSMYYEISMELPEYDIDYFGGGGFHYSRGKKGKKPDAYKNAVTKGYTIANNAFGFNLLKNGTEKVFAINPVLYPYGEFYWAIDKKEGAFSLADFTAKGIEVLENDKGFFMMVEGGKIDWACHANDAATMVHEVLAFNDAIEVAYEFYKEHADETLIIVTADHETGSMFTGHDYAMNPELLKHQKISSQEFTRVISELKTNKPASTFDDVMALVSDNFGLGIDSVNLTLSAADSAQLQTAYNLEFIEKQVVDADADYLDSSDELTISETAVSILNRKAGIGWGSDDHSGMPVPVRVIGAGQEYFTDYFDNTELRGLMQEAMDIIK